MFKDKIISEFEGKNILILGFGKEGKTTYDFLKSNNVNCKISIADKNKDIDSLCNVEMYLGENYIDSIYKAWDIIIKSPGISFKEIDLNKVTATLTSQTELLLKHGKNKIIGITGTKGKSTTSTLLYNILNKKYSVKLIGNIGVPPFLAIDNWDDTDYFVYEMSCHQLEKIKYSPKISVFLNIFEEHLDHYESYKQYIEAKRNIFKHQTSDDIFLFNDFFAGKIVGNNMLNQINIALISPELCSIYENNSEVRESVSYDLKNFVSINNSIIDIELENYKNKQIILPSDIKNIRGIHNYYNAMVAITISYILGVSDKDIISALKEFTGLSHRLQYIGTYNGVDYVDDSISTIPEATINGITSINNVQSVLIGGMDRGIDYSALCSYLENLNIKNIIFMYDTGKQIYDKLTKKTSVDNMVYVENLEEAVKYAALNTPKGSTCLLSPAAASYGYFKNFEDRGDKFKEYVIKYTK